MRLSIVIGIVGRILRVLSLAFLAPAVVTLIYRDLHELGGFLLGGAIAGIISVLMVRSSHEVTEDLRRIEALAVVSGTWLVVALVGSVPYLWVGLAPVDAVFESMSGFTTTGATILRDF